MANDGEIDVGFGLDGSSAEAELSKLQRQLQGITADFANASATISRAVAANTRDITNALAKAKNLESITRLTRRLDAATAATLGTQSRGTRASQISNAAAQQLISEANSTADQITARLSEAYVRAFQQRIRTTDQAVQARLQTELARVGRLVSNSDPRVLQARSVLQSRSNERAIYEAQNGRVAANTRDRFETLDHNGGADLIAIQSRLLIGYQALNLAFRAAHDAANFVIQLDQEFRQFQAITAATDGEMATFKDRLIDISTQSKFSAVDLAKAATIMGQAGLSIKEVSESIGAVQLLATAAGTDLNSAVDVVTSTMSIWNLRTSQATEISNTLTAALNLSKLSIDKLTLGFQYAGNTAASLGITYQQLTGALGALANAGIKSGSTIGTGLRSLLIDLQTPTEKFKKDLDALKLSQEDVDVASNGLLPVLKKLKDAGFGASQAFNDFEVRSAAAYIALSNNVDVAQNLEKQFILSSAAVEANAIQLKGLEATYGRFSSVVGDIAYKAFQPLLSVLQSTISTATDVLSVLNQFPGLLNALTAAVSGLFAVLAVSTTSALIRGLVGGIPLISSFTRALAAAGAAEGAFAGATSGVTTVLGVLFTVMKAHPILLLIGAITTAAVAFQAFAPKVQTLEDRIDALKTQVDTFTGSANSAKEAITSIGTTIDTLIKQKAALDRDPLMREAKILEVAEQFKEVANSVDSATSSVNDLIDALHKLSQQDYTKIAADLKGAISSQEALIQTYQDKYNRDQKNGYSDLFSVASSAYHIVGDDPSTTAKEAEKFVVDAFRRVFGSDFGTYAQYGFGQASVPTDPSKAGFILSNIDSRISQLTSQQAILQSKSSAGNISQADVQVLNALPEMINMLQVLKANLAPLVAGRVNVAAAEAKKKGLEQNLLEANIRGSDVYASLVAQVDSLKARVQARLQQVTTETRGKKAEDVVAALGSVHDEFDTQVQQLKDSAAQAVTKLAADNQATPTQVENVVKDLIDTANSLGNQISTKINSENQILGKAQAKILKEQDDTAQAAIQLQLKQAGRTHSADELEAIRNYILQQYDIRRKLTNSIWDAEAAAAGNDATKLDQIEQQRQEALKQVNIAEQKTISDLAQRAVDQQVDFIDETKKSVDDSISATKDKLNELITAIAKAKPGPAMDALIAQFNTLKDQLELLSQQSNSLDLQSGALRNGLSPLSTSQASSAQDMLKFFTDAGFTKNQASGIVGNLITESGLNPENVNSIGAYGLAQWLGSRKTRLQQFGGASAGTTETQLRFILNELNTNPEYGLDKLKSAQTSSEAALIFSKYFERPESDPLKSHLNDRISYAQQLAGLPSESQSQDSAGLVSKESRAAGTAVANAVKKASDIASQALTRQINSLTAQAGRVSDPKTIEKIIDSVNKTYDDLITEKTKAFDAANKNSDDPELDQQRQQLTEGIVAQQNQKVAELLDKYFEALDKKLQEPVAEAKAKLAAAQSPLNVNRYTDAQLNTLQNNVTLAEQAAQAREVTAAETVLLNVRKELAQATATYGEGSQEVAFWENEEAKATDRVTQLTRDKAAADEAASHSSASLSDAIQSANQSFLQQQGILDANGDLVPMAKQLEAAWTPVLDALSSGFQTLFTDLVDGTKSAGDAFKAFGLSVVQALEQAIAKALALQIMTQLLGINPDGSSATAGAGGGSNGGIFSVLANLLTVPGKALGGIIRAAGGTAPFRDSRLALLMPGEAVLRQSAVQHIGEDNVTSLNNLGNRSLSNGVPQVQQDQKQSGGTVNVYVVSPDQVPSSLGPNDVIAHVADNIQRRGSLKQLIKQVAIGAI